MSEAKSFERSINNHLLDELSQLQQRLASRTRCISELHDEIDRLNGIIDEQSCLLLNIRLGKAK
jgi:hypothetical protein